MRYFSSIVLLITGILLICLRASAEEFPESAKSAFEEADHFALLSIDPKKPDEKPVDEFHGWRVLGRTVIKDFATRKALGTALAKGVSDNEGDVADCFDPRHAVHAKVKGKTIDILICFECMNVELYIDDVRQAGFLTTDSPQPAFDKVLRKAGIVLAPRD